RQENADAYHGRVGPDRGEPPLQPPIDYLAGWGARAVEDHQRVWTVEAKGFSDSIPGNVFSVRHRLQSKLQTLGNRPTIPKLDVTDLRFRAPQRCHSFHTGQRLLQYFKSLGR